MTRWLQRPQMTTVAATVVVIGKIVPGGGVRARIAAATASATEPLHPKRWAAFGQR